MKTWVPLLVPCALLIACGLVFALSNMGSEWATYASFHALPYLLAVIGFLLGCFFVQSRVSFLCVLFALIAFLVDESFLGGEDAPRAALILFLASIYVPVLGVLFYHLGERGMFNLHGGARMAVVLSAGAVMVVLPMMEPLTEAVFATRHMLFKPLSSVLPLPAIGVVAFAASIPFFFIRKTHESPLLGPILCLSVLGFFVALNFGSSFWLELESSQQMVLQRRAVLVAFSSCSIATLGWAVLESSWRNAHIDELTQLPGRRSLKHHMARLTSSFAMAIVDVDHFKKINDRHGHDVGDQVLRYMASSLAKVKVGKPYRYGGEEFVIVCEGDDYDGIASALDGLRESIQEREFVLRAKDRPRRKPESSDKSAGAKPRKGGRRSQDAAGKKSIKISVSIGLARHGGRFATPNEVLQAADRALYRAKNRGRNRLCLTR